MLHLTLAANVLNAVGGTPDLTRPDFVPQYPTYLPDGESDFEVNVQRFSRETLDDFLEIERPAPPRPPETPDKRLIQRPDRPRIVQAVKTSNNRDLHFWTIGEFYAEIGDQMKRLEAKAEKKHETIFVGDPKRQVTPAYYYSGGGEITAVYDLKTALEAIRLISEQGEGYGGGIFDHEGELSHYYRFQQLKLGRCYQKGDKPDHPSGVPVEVQWDEVYPVKTNARLSDYPKGSELYDAVLDFRETYQRFLGRITQALSGRPELFLPAVGDMFRLKEKFYHLLHNPIPGQDGVHAAPVFGPIS
jgi:hypothetical protein